MTTYMPKWKGTPGATWPAFNQEHGNAQGMVHEGELSTVPFHGNGGKRCTSGTVECDSDFFPIRGGTEVFLNEVIHVLHEFRGAGTAVEGIIGGLKHIRMVSRSGHRPLSGDTNSRGLPWGEQPTWQIV